MLPSIKDHEKGRKKNILGVDLENGRTEEKVSIKTHKTNDNSEKFESDGLEQSELGSLKKNFKIELIPQEIEDAPDKIVKPVPPPQPMFHATEKILNLDDLIDSPTKKDEPKGPSPKFRFRSMRSGGTMLVFSKANSGWDPVSIYNSLVCLDYAGRFVQEPVSRHMD